MRHIYGVDLEFPYEVPSEGIVVCKLVLSFCGTLLIPNVKNQ